MDNQDKPYIDKNGTIVIPFSIDQKYHFWNCLLYTSDAADDLPCVDPGGRRIIQKKKHTHH